jgi:hypothetical protein
MIVLLDGTGSALHRKVGRHHLGSSSTFAPPSSFLKSRESLLKWARLGAGNTSTISLSDLFL